MAIATYDILLSESSIQNVRRQFFNLEDYECRPARTVEKATQLTNDIYITSSIGTLTLHGTDLYPSLSYLSDAFDRFALMNRNADVENQASVSSIGKAKAFLFEYARTLFSCYNNFCLDIPAMSGLPDGSIDLEWRTPNAIFVINFNNNDQFGYYYGQLMDKDSDLNGKIAATDFETYISSFLQEHFRYSGQKS